MSHPLKQAKAWPLTCSCHRCAHSTYHVTFPSRSFVGADIQDRLGRTPLFWAVYGGHDATVELLLRRKAKAGIVDNVRGQGHWGLQGRWAGAGRQPSSQGAALISLEQHTSHEGKRISNKDMFYAPLKVQDYNAQHGS